MRMTGRGIAASLCLLAAAVAGCSATHHPSARARSYLAIANPANRVLDISFDALDDHAGDVGASAPLLQTIASTERGFDKQLAALQLPAPMDAVATELVRVNEARADLTARPMIATTSDELKRDVFDIEAMNVPVEVQVRALRKDLGLPPPDTD